MNDKLKLSGNMKEIPLKEEDRKASLSFTESFPQYACFEDYIETKHGLFTLRATLKYDIDYHINYDDVHNPDQEVTGCDEKQQARLMQAREAWFNNEWCYCGVVLSAEYNGVPVSDHYASLWAIEMNYPDTDNSHLLEVANELLPEALEEAQKELQELRQKLNQEEPK